MTGVNLPKGFNPKDKQYRKFANKLPTRENCDLTDPREMFLWMFIALPGMNGGQMAFPASVGMVWSEHFHELGAMLECPDCGHTRQPEKVYVPPAAEDPHWLTSPGRWKKPGEVPKPDKDAADAALDALTSTQQATILLRILGKMSPAQVEGILNKHKAGEL